VIWGDQNKDGKTKKIFKINLNLICCCCYFFCFVDAAAVVFADSVVVAAPAADAVGVIVVTAVVIVYYYYFYYYYSYHYRCCCCCCYYYWGGGGGVNDNDNGFTFCSRIQLFTLPHHSDAPTPIGSTLLCIPIYDTQSQCSGVSNSTSISSHHPVA
jgi:hypothetical protein